MLRWNNATLTKQENEKIDNYIKEIINLSKKYKLSITQKDFRGIFVIEKYKEIYTEWLNAAQILIRD